MVLLSTKLRDIRIFRLLQLKDWSTLLIIAASDFSLLLADVYILCILQTLGPFDAKKVLISL
jgi:hypothetical protein